MTTNVSAQSQARGGSIHGRVVLHRLSLDERKVRLLERSGIEVVRARSVREVCEAIDGATERVYVLVDLSVGSNAPEKIREHLENRRREGGRALTFLACSTKRSPGSKRRAASLGLREVFVWPEGGFGELLRRLAMLPDVTLHRLAERAFVRDGITAGDGLAFEGDLVNISSSGAMIECGLEHEHITGLTFEINVFDHATEIHARVRWRERVVKDGEERMRMGVQFVGMSPAARAAIDRFVRHTNVIRVGRPEAQKKEPPDNVRVRARRGKRADFFLLRGDLAEGALLVPRKPFFVPYEVGDALQLDILSPRVMGVVDVEIVAREMLDADRVDGRVGWRVRVRDASSARAPAAMTSSSS